MTLPSASDSGAHPTGITAPATTVRMSETASPRRKIWTSCRPSTKALAWWKGNAACVGSADPHALLMRTFIALPPLRSGGPIAPLSTRRRLGEDVHAAGRDLDVRVRVPLGRLLDAPAAGFEIPHELRHLK